MNETKDKRISWDDYFMNIAKVVASRTTCKRVQSADGLVGVGAVIVRDKVILSTGYNGSIRGLPHCDEVGHDMVEGHCVRTVHAETNAVVQAAKNGVSIDGATIYTTASPCWDCFKLLANGGIKRIVFGQFYREEKTIQTAKQLDIELVDLSNNS